MQDYGRALWHSIGGKWLFLPGMVSGLIGIYGFLQNDLRWLPTMSWWVVIPLALAPLILWAIGGLTRQVVLLERRLRPKLKCSFASADAGCIRPNTVVSFANRQKVRCTYYRIRVQTDCSGHVPDCRGRLILIRRGKNVLFEGENLILPFAHSGNSVRIDQGVPEYLDFIVITNDNNIWLGIPHFMGPSSIKYNELFSQPGDYEFHIAISSPQCPSVLIKPVLKWSGDRLTSEMTDVAGQLLQP